MFLQSSYLYLLFLFIVFILLLCSYFGEIALVKTCPRTATVTTASRCVLMRLSREQFDQFFKAAPEVFLWYFKEGGVVI